MFQEQNNNTLSINFSSKIVINISKQTLFNVFQNFLNENFINIKIDTICIIDKKIHIVLNNISNDGSCLWTWQYDRLINKIYSSIKKNFSIVVDSIIFKI